MSTNSRGGTNQQAAPRRAKGQHLPANVSQSQFEELRRRIDESVPDIEQLLVATGGILLIGVLFIVLPGQVTLGPSWLLLVLEALLLAPSLVSGIIARRHLPFRLARSLAMTLTILVTGDLILSVGALVRNLTTLRGASLLETGATLYTINVLVFAAWYWEIDHGGPIKRMIARRVAVDFQFPQHAAGNPQRWLPGFVDYLFLAFCTSTALSPADTVPLTRRAKLLMMMQSIIALIVLAIIVGRSINVLT